MSLNMNVFRIIADVSHTLSKCILIWAIHRNQSAEGVSLITQVLYCVVFLTRYLDLFWVPPAFSWYNFVMKNFYIWSSLYIILIMTKKYARTREREKAWKFAAYISGGTIVLTPIVALIFRRAWADFSEILWIFSIILESVCVLPQLLLLRQTTVPTVIDSYYLVFLGSYRAFYILNWIWKGSHKQGVDPISVVFGVVQTLFYLDFAWVYWTRQRVKLRGGAIVDTDDLRKGFLVNRFSHVRQSLDGELENGDAQVAGQRTGTNRWGARAVSIRADDTLEDHDRTNHRDQDALEEETEPLKDPGHFESDDEDDDAPILGSSNHLIILKP